MVNINTKQRLALFLPSLVGGGAERVFVTLANEFAKRNIVVDLIICTDADADYLHEVSSDVNIHIIGVHRMLFATGGLVRYLRKFRPRWLLTAMSHTNVIAKFALLLSRTSTHHVIRQTLSPGIMQFGRGSNSWPLRDLVSMTYRNASAVVSISNEMTPMIRDYYGVSDNVYCILNPVDVGGVVDKSFKPSFKVLASFKSEVKIIVAMGRLCEQKDYPTLLKAFSLVREKLEAKLVIFGEGPDRESLLKYAMECGVDEHIWLPGFCVNPFPFIRQADVFVLSSLFEGLPNSLIQAQLLGVRCVSTRCPTGPSEVLEGGRLGALVEVGDFQDMAEQIINTIKGPCISSGQLDSLREKYSVQNIATQYMDLLESL